MKQLKTHYDNLKVTRNAPDEVIRAAYKTLSQKHHPDKNLGDANSARIMAIINASYDVLSDPARRLAHDEWIAEQERVSSHEPKQHSHKSADSSDQKENRQSTNHAKGNSQNINPQSGDTEIGDHILKFWYIYLALLLGIIYWIVQNSTGGTVSDPGNVRTNQQQSIGTQSEIVAQYAEGYPFLNATGKSTVTIDNALNNSNVLAKLVSINGKTSRVVRAAYIPARSSIIMEHMSPGQYEIRYKHFATNLYSVSQQFELTEVEVNNTMFISQKTMLLQPATANVGRTDAIMKADFEIK